MKRVKTHKGFGIYKRSAKEMAEKGWGGLEPCEYAVFLPYETPQGLCTPEWECETIQEAIEFIDSY